MSDVAVSIRESWPAMEVFLRPLAELIPYIRNPRAHSDEQIAQIAASMREFGWVNPVLVDEDSTILAGHGRILAARRMSWSEVPVMVARGWSEAKKRAYVIADNKLALNASWDVALLDSEIKALQEDAFDLALLGFSDTELQRLNDDATELAYDRSAQPDATSTPGQSAGASTPSVELGSDQVAFTVPVTVAERNVIFEAIQKAKNTFGLNLSGVALCRICKLFSEQT